MRKCINCNDEIKECMGFVLARDIINKRNPVREICGKCAFILLEMNEDQLREKLNEYTLK